VATVTDNVDWKVSDSLVEYGEAVAFMDTHAAAIRDQEARELVWLLQHDHVYTAGTSAAAKELVAPGAVPVFKTGRGGRYTYHGPGQRVGYVMLDLNRRGRDVRHYVHSLEGWLIAALADLGVAAHRAPGRIGLWVDTPSGEAKIGAIGVRIRRWVTLHGFALNVSPDLARFDGIIPCGLPDYAVTSLRALGRAADMGALDRALAGRFPAFLDTLSTGSQREPTSICLSSSAPFK
jgi:lipoyl(octanoyl) transferase